MSEKAAREPPADEGTRLRGALSESERSSLSLVDSIPGLVALLAADFIHIRSRHPNSLAMIVTHGWPGSA
jgi:hypothetical protein